MLLALSLALSASYTVNLANAINSQYGTLVNLEIGRVCYEYNEFIAYNIYRTCICDLCLRVIMSSRLPERACVLVGLEQKSKYNIELICVDAKKHKWLIEAR